MAKVDAYFINELLKALNVINQSSLPPKQIDGNIGERFVKDGLKYYLWGKDFKVSKSGKRTFRIGGPYKPVRGGMGGIDFRLQVQYNKNYYDCYVEVKNWNYQKHITPNTMQTEIVDRFTKNANQKGNIWILVMNKKNINQIQQTCNINNITIIPINTKITQTHLTPKRITPIMEQFIDDIDTAMQSIIGTTISKLKGAPAISSPGNLDWELELGLPYDLIASRHNKSNGDVRKRARDLRNQGVKLPDRRTAEWRGMQLITNKKEYDFVKSILEQMCERRFD